MKLQVFAVRDAKAQTFGNPFCFPTAGVALRSLASEVNKGGPDSMIAQHPDDFEIFHLGEFDPQVARFDLFDDPRPLMLASGLKTSGNGSA